MGVKENNKRWAQDAVGLFYVEASNERQRSDVLQSLNIRKKWKSLEQNGNLCFGL